MGLEAPSRAPVKDVLRVPSGFGVYRALGLRYSLFRLKSFVFFIGRVAFHETSDPKRAFVKEIQRSTLFPVL